VELPRLQHSPGAGQIAMRVYLEYQLISQFRLRQALPTYRRAVRASLGPSSLCRAANIAFVGAAGLRRVVRASMITRLMPRSSTLSARGTWIVPASLAGHVASTEFQDTSSLRATNIWCSRLAAQRRPGRLLSPAATSSTLTSRQQYLVERDGTRKRSSACRQYAGIQPVLARRSCRPIVDRAWCGQVGVQQCLGNIDSVGAVARAPRAVISGRTQGALRTLARMPATSPAFLVIAARYRG
jgi:hypothetical protein